MPETDGGQLTELPPAADVVARLEEIAGLPLPPEATDVTDRVDQVEAQSPRGCARTRHFAGR